MCPIYDGEHRCGGLDNVTCTRCGDGKLEPDDGEECDGTTDCGVDCKFLCGNGRLDSGEDCDKVTGCNSNCTAALDYVCANNSCTTCGNEKYDP